jgi:hypothetical protein
MYLLTLSSREERQLRFGPGYPFPEPEPGHRWSHVPRPTDVIVVARRTWWGQGAVVPVHQIYALLQAATVSVEDTELFDRAVVTPVRFRLLPRPFNLEALQLSTDSYFDGPALRALDPLDADAVTESGLLQPCVTEIAAAPPIGDPSQWLWVWPVLMLDGPGSHPPYGPQLTEWEQVSRQSPVNAWAHAGRADDTTPGAGAIVRLRAGVSRSPSRLQALRRRRLAVRP